MRGRNGLKVSRFFSFRLAILLIACSAMPAQAQDLDRGKTPAQVFSSNCTACHRGPQGLSKGGNARATAGFLLQHYTTSAESAGAIAAYLVAVGGDPRTARLRPSPAETPEAPQRAAPQSPDGDERRERATPREGGPPVAARSKPRKRGEPATVSSDPPLVITSSDPIPLVQERVAVQTPPRRSDPPAASRPVARPEAGTPPGNGAPAIAADPPVGGIAPADDSAAAGRPGGTIAARQSGSGDASTHPAASGAEGAVPHAAPAEPKPQVQEGFSSPLP